MSARTRAERDRSRALLCEALAAVLGAFGVAGAVIGYVRYGAPDPTGLPVVTAALALQAHAHVYRLRATVERIADRVGDPS